MVIFSLDCFGASLRWEKKAVDEISCDDAMQRGFAKRVEAAHSTGKPHLFPEGENEFLIN